MSVRVETGTFILTQTEMFGEKKKWHEVDSKKAALVVLNDSKDVTYEVTTEKGKDEYPADPENRVIVVTPRGASEDLRRSVSSQRLFSFSDGHA